jgi:hypothetical protein
MNFTIWLWILFIALNILDGITTWLNIFKLPKGLVGREANPLFSNMNKSSAEKSIAKESANSLIQNVEKDLGLSTGAIRNKDGTESQIDKLVKDKMKANFKTNMTYKLVIVLAGLYIFLQTYIKDQSKGTFIFEILDLVILFAVINNTGIYIAKRIKKRDVMTPIGLVERGLTKIKLPKRLARFLSYYVIVTFFIFVSVLIVYAAYGLF